MKRAILLIFSLFVIVAVNADKPTIGVYVGGDTQEAQIKVFKSAITQALNDDGGFTVVERQDEFLNDFRDQEANLQRSGTVSDEYVSQLSKVFGAQYLFAVDISELYGEMFATARIYNMETMKVEASSDASGMVNSMSSLRSLATKLASNTISQLPEKKEEQEKIRRANEILSKSKLVKVYRAKDFWIKIKSNLGEGYRIADLDDIKVYQNARETLGQKKISDIYYSCLTKEVKEVVHGVYVTYRRITSVVYPKLTIKMTSWIDNEFGVTSSNPEINGYMLLVSF